MANPNVTKSAVTLAVAAVGGGWLSSLWNPQSPSVTRNDASSPRSVASPVAMNALPMSPTLPIRVIRPNENLEIAYDVRTRNAVYVMEKLDRGGEKLGKWHRRPNFFEEKGMPEAYRSKLTHYKNSGYDRGHLAPAADFPAKTEDTYNLCNVSPQNHQMNMSIWCQIEEFVRRTADNTPDDCETFVVTGPLWLPVRQLAPATFEYSYPAIGEPPSLVAVPTHFYKVVAVVSKVTTIVQFACFVVPNSEPDKDKGMEDYVVAWTDLENVTGLQFFPRIATDEFKSFADKITHQAVLQHRAGQRLLTDGSTNSRVSPRSIPKTLQHLCKNGVCR